MLRWRYHAQAQAARKTEGREEENEAGWTGRNPAGGVSRPAQGRGVERRVAQPVRKVANKVQTPDVGEAVAQKSALQEYAEAFGIAVILAVVLRAFFVQAY